MDNVIAYFIVAIIVLWSCYVVLRRFMPKTSFAAQQRFAIWLSSIGLAWLSNRLHPTAAQSGCSVGCSDCSVKAPSPKTTVNSMSAEGQTEEQPVQWRL